MPGQAPRGASAPEMVVLRCEVERPPRMLLGLRQIAQQHPGKQLNTTMGQSGGRAVYLVQWQLANGQIVVFTVDAQTGQIVG